MTLAGQPGVRDSGGSTPSLGEPFVPASRHPVESLFMRCSGRLKVGTYADTRMLVYTTATNKVRHVSEGSEDIEYRMPDGHQRNVFY
jgi:hypothetical protein